MKNERKFVPLMIDLSNRNIIIFGGGKVGERKAVLFSECSRTTVISSDFTDVLTEMGKRNKVNLIEMELSYLQDTEIKKLLSSAFLVITATSDHKLNLRIANIAKGLDILVNEVDDAGDVVVPSVIKHGELIIGISTSGSSPAVSKYTRHQIEKLITPEYADMIRIQQSIREYLKQNVPEQMKRKDILWQILESRDIWTQLSDSYEKAYDQALKIAEDHISSGKHINE
ncbi:siroheme synthase [Methanosalsum zhilinae DSM 4017]|uniref:precorrin-2 dehydrogenase n=1 Tax=Methanosalsum zhilinae (strain DSM 4017 / NBRC 107636 / OCM 62 / WeN5) TaxID=679901 RepID=F7XP40_METZD|nr:bifunctional precorrin-2 dehydrogenase/sirohydrochlorin ferrochelatase [Methanosalsum zhilinae]AEH61332.1 siroheme synthase [Methanosalsum zhilinae DSM 4017]